MDKRVNRGIVTRDRIVAAATGLFAEHGFASVSIEAICAACDVSRGALFHHFVSKEALFTAVLEQVEATVAERMRDAASRAGSAREALQAGCEAWLAMAASDPVVRRVVLMDAPSVVGWTAWREIDGRQGLGLIRQALAAASPGRRPSPGHVDLTAHGLLAVLVEMALLIAAAPSDAALARSARRYVGVILEATLATPSARSAAPRPARPRAR